MNYYERHLGDHAKLTGHLSMLEHGAYILLTDRYYATEAPLPAANVHRVAKARSKEEREAVDVVLSEFFELRDAAWHHAKIDLELAGYRQREPERAAKERNEETRLSKHREERARLFADLNAQGVHMPWNAPIGEVRALHKRTCNAPATGTETQPATPETAPETACNAPETPPATATATPATHLQRLPISHSPLPTPQYPLPNSKNQDSEPIGSAELELGQPEQTIDQALFSEARRIFGKAIGGQVNRAIKAKGKPWMVGIIDACKGKDPEQARAYFAAALNGAAPRLKPGDIDPSVAPA